MTLRQTGGCLCRAIRYTVTAEPIRVTICHCTFCQKITGSAYLVEPIFKREDVRFSGTQPVAFAHRSEGSGMMVTVNFCATCGTSLCLDLERFPDVMGLFGGTFDDPNWFDRASKNCRHIFTRSAQDGVVLPVGVDTFSEHAFTIDGTPNKPRVLDYPMMVSRKRT